MSIAPASPEMMSLVHSAQNMPKVAPAPAVLAKSCYCCKEDCDDYFCSEACELYYDTLMDHGLRKPDFVCEDCGYYINPRDAQKSSICQNCQYSDDYRQDEDEIWMPVKTAAENYYEMFPYNNKIPHEISIAVAAANEFMAAINDSTSHMDKAYHSKFLFNYIADHGQLLLKNTNFTQAVLAKMTEFEKYEATMSFYNFPEVFGRLREMIAKKEE